MIEPSEDSFETMMELKNPSSKQMESSEGSSNTVEETPSDSAGQAQAEAGSASGPAQEPPSGLVKEVEELPTDLLQDMEKSSSGPCVKTEDPPNDLLQDLEESPSAPCGETEDAPRAPLEDQDLEESPSAPCGETEDAPRAPLEDQDLEESPSAPCGETEDAPHAALEDQDLEESPSAPCGETEDAPRAPLEDQDLEESPSAPCGETEDAPHAPLEDLEEPCGVPHAGDEDDPISDTSDGLYAVSADSSETPTYGEYCTNLEGVFGEGQEENSPEEVMSRMGSIISLFLRMQDARQQQIVAEEILTDAIDEGRLPSIRPFTGDRRDYHEFIVLCQMTMQNYPAMFSSDHIRVKFFIHHMTSLALEWANTLIEQNSPLLHDFSAFLEALSDKFEYRQTLRVAEDAMFSIRQGNRSVADYINEFLSLVPTLGWPDEVLQAHLCQGLNEDIRHYLFRIPQPQSLHNLMVLVLQIEDKLAERRAVLRLPPESRPRNMTWIDSPVPERWRVSSWLPYAFHPDIDRAHLFLLLMVRVSPYHSVAVQALLDSGAEGNYMDEKFAQEHYVELYERPYPQTIQTADGSLIGNEPTWLYTEPLMCVQQNHYEYIEFDIVPSPHFSVVLGIKWLRTHAPDVDWIKGRCTFHSPYCLKNCFNPPPPCIALEQYSMSLLPGLPHPYSDLADVFNPKEADDETSDQPSSDGSDDLSESEPSELQQAGDSDRNDVFYECRSKAPWVSVSARMQEKARQQEEYWILYDMLTDRQDYIQMIPELFDQLHGAAWFTKLELRRDIKEADVNYSVSRTEDTWRATFGLTVHQMRCYRPFTMCSFADESDNEIHFVLKDILGFYVIARGQEVLVYSMSQEEHLEHVRQVLLRFRNNNIYCSLDGSQFHRQTAEIMGFVLTPKGVKLNKTLMNLIMGCPVPGNRKCLQTIIELVYPYRHFVEHFAIIADPLLRQLLSSEPYYWGEEEQEAFECLKRAFRKAPLLYHPKPQNPFYLETGVSGPFLYASLVQTDEETGKKATCAFYSRHLSPMEVEYPRVELRILPIRASFMVWCRYLENTEEPIMILLNTEDLASLNNDRLTVLLPGHWVFFFSHFRFDVMELPDDDDPRALFQRRGQYQRVLRGRLMRPLLLLAMRAAQRNTSSNFESESMSVSASESESGSESESESESESDDSGSVSGSGYESESESESEDSDDISYEDSEDLHRQSLVQELLATIPINQILNGFLAHFSVAQIRAIVLNFFHSLLYWKSILSVAALLVMMRVRQHLSPLPGPSLEVDRPQPRHTLRLILDSSLIAGSGMATAIAQLFSQMPPLMGANTLPARQLAELFLSPRCWHRNALHSGPRRGLRFTPGFWLTLCEFFGVRVNPEDDIFPAPHQHRYLELHVVGDEDVVLREALQDDLQRYRHRGLHDGLQDTSQDAQGNDVREDMLGDPEAVTFRPRNLLDPEVLDFLNNRLLYILGADGRLTLLSRDEVARALARFLAMASRMVPPSPARERARLRQLSDSSDDELD